MDFLESFENSTRHIVPKLPWMEGVHMELVTLETLDRVIDECIAAPRYALDLETTGLDTRVFNGRTQAKIVGFCLSPDGKKGYYIPVRHRKGEQHNLPLLVVETAIRRLVNSGNIAIFHNAKFDQEFLQFCGGEPMGTWDESKKFEDTLILTWLRNTRQKIKGLKFMARTELGKDMIELKQLFAPDYKGPLDFSELDPSWDPCVWYACSDAICTWLLFEHIHPQVVAPDGERKFGQESIYNIEKNVVPAVRWMERCRIYIKQDKVTELIRLGQQEMFDCLCDVYDFCNKTLGRNVEPGFFRLLRSRFVPDDPKFDISIQIDECRKEARRTGIDDISDFVEDVSDFADFEDMLTGPAEPSKDKKLKGLYIDKEITLMIEDREETFLRFPERYDVLSRPQLGPLFCELQIPGLSRTDKSAQIQTTADEIERLEKDHGDKYPFLPKIKRLGELQKALGTYLISLSNDVGPDGTLKANFNQCGTDTGRFTTPASDDPSLDGGTSYPVHGTPATYDKSRPACLLGVRETFSARPGKVVVSVDYGGVELRIGTILSGEPKWLVEYFRCSNCGLEFDRGPGGVTPPAPPGYCPRCGDDKIGDLHTATAIAFYGPEAVGGKHWKHQRQGAKATNFAMAFGGGPSAIRRSIGCDEVEAARHHRSFTSTYHVLKNWWDEVKEFGRQHGFVRTAFGRRYPIPDILLTTNPQEVRADLMSDANREKFTHRIRDRLCGQYRVKYRKTKIVYDPAQSPLQMAAKAFISDYRADTSIRRKITDDKELAQKAIESVKKAEVWVINDQVDRNRKFKAKAERNATNGPVQGLSADITKIAMALIYKECRKRGWLTKVLMTITIHDELVFEIDEDILVEAIEMIRDLMARNPIILGMKWPVPLTTDCEIGWDWSVPWNLKDFEYHRVRPDGLQTDEKGKLPRGKGGKLSAKRWPQKFLDIFGPKYGFAPILDNPTEEEGKALFGSDWVPLPLSEDVPPPEFVEPPAPPPVEVKAALAENFPELQIPEESPPPQEAAQALPVALPPTQAPETPMPPPVPSAPSTGIQGDVFSYRLRMLSVGTAEKLAHIIVRCQGTGTRLLKLYGPKGEELLLGSEIRVNPVKFETLVEDL